MIEKVELVAFALRFREPYVTARGKLDRRELLLVRLHTDDGLIGLGETGPLALRGGPGLSEIVACIRERYAPVLHGSHPDPSNITELIGRLWQTGHFPQAIAGVDLALWDLVGKRADKPIWQLLGANEPPNFTCNATLTTGEPADVAEQAQRWADLGFQTFKLKVGTANDREKVAAVRKTVGPQAQIRIDANGVWEPEEAITILSDLEQSDIELCEQPVATLAGMAEVGKATEIPLAADEIVVSPEDARRAVTDGGCDAVTVKVAKAGGIEATRTVMESAPAYLSSAIDGPLGIAAAAHLAALLPQEGFAAGLAQGLATAHLLAETIAADPQLLQGDEMKAPTEPGLGIEIDQAALDDCRI